MAETYEIQRVWQVGVEGTPGTLVPATKQLASMQLQTTVADTAATFMPSGYQAHTVSAFSKGWTTGRVTGKPTFGEIIYALSQIFGAAAITTPGGGTLSRQWLWDWKGNVIDTPVAMSYENGDSAQSDAIPGNVFTDFGLAFDRGKVDLTGATLGGLLDPTATLTGSLSSPEAVMIPLTSNAGDLWIDPTAASLGTTKFLRAFDGSFAWTGKYGPAWPINSALTSFALRAPLAPKASVSLTVGQDAQGQGILTAIRNNTRQFVRVKWTGPIIETTIHYIAQFDLAVDITAAGAVKVVDGYHCRSFTGEIAHDPTWGEAAKITIVNKQTAL